MARPDTLIVDGHAFGWQRLCGLRRQQLEAGKKAEMRQLALFDLRTDCQAAVRSARGLAGIKSQACWTASEAVEPRR
jgi:hypothetical protein